MNFEALSSSWINMFSPRPSVLSLDIVTGAADAICRCFTHNPECMKVICIKAKPRNFVCTHLHSCMIAVVPMKATYTWSSSW